MNHWRPHLAVFLAAVVAGAVVLGVGGRLAMAGLSVANGNRLAFSWGGSLEVVALGTFYGTIGAIPLAIIRRFWASGWTRGAVHGALMLGIAWLSSTVGRSTAAASPTAVPAILGVSLVVFILYGLLADRLAGLISARWRIDSEI